MPNVSFFCSNSLDMNSFCASNTSSVEIPRRKPNCCDDMIKYFSQKDVILLDTVFSGPYDMTGSIEIGP